MVFNRSIGCLERRGEGAIPSTLTIFFSGAAGAKEVIEKCSIGELNSPYA